MAIANSLKGLQNLKTIQTTKKEKDSNFLKLYLLDKERNRLRAEQTRLYLRLETINMRLKDIEDFYASMMQTKMPTAAEQKAEKNDGEKKWKTMPIDY